ncbi:MAG: pyridoxamine 5'-phosphate oxidase, partial [Colwellia sp.]|nr:pyridoxamine 5'-phosphate oxidase [Colwellia sp.]
MFRLTGKDGAILPAFEAGAHLPIDVILSAKNTVQRHYSIISSSHDNRFYDIAVQQKPQGRGGSNYLHQQVKIGEVLTAKSPVNDFSLSSSGKHHVLIAGGIGITPILAMLKVLSEND